MMGQLHRAGPQQRVTSLAGTVMVEHLPVTSHNQSATDRAIRGTALSQSSLIAFPESIPIPHPDPSSDNR